LYFLIQTDFIATLITPVDIKSKYKSIQEIPE